MRTGILARVLFVMVGGPLFIQSSTSVLGESPPALSPGGTDGETRRTSDETMDLHHFFSE